MNEFASLDRCLVATAVAYLATRQRSPAAGGLIAGRFVTLTDALAMAPAERPAAQVATAAWRVAQSWSHKGEDLHESERCLTLALGAFFVERSDTQLRELGLDPASMTAFRPT